MSTPRHTEYSVDINLLKITSFRIFILIWLISLPLWANAETENGNMDQVKQIPTIIDNINDRPAKEKCSTCTPIYSTQSLSKINKCISDICNFTYHGAMNFVKTDATEALKEFDDLASQLKKVSLELEKLEDTFKTSITESKIDEAAKAKLSPQFVKKLTQMLLIMKAMDSFTVDTDKGRKGNSVYIDSIDFADIRLSAKQVGILDKILGSALNQLRTEMNVELAVKNPVQFIREKYPNLKAVAGFKKMLTENNFQFEEMTKGLHPRLQEVMRIWFFAKNNSQLMNLDNITKLDAEKVAYYHVVIGFLKKVIASQMTPQLMDENILMGIIQKGAKEVRLEIQGDTPIDKIDDQLDRMRAEKGIAECRSTIADGFAYLPHLGQIASAKQRIPQTKLKMIALIKSKLSSETAIALTPRIRNIEFILPPTPDDFKRKILNILESEKHEESQTLKLAKQILTQKFEDLQIFFFISGIYDNDNDHSEDAAKSLIRYKAQLKYDEGLTAQERIDKFDKKMNETAHETSDLVAKCRNLLIRTVTQEDNSDVLFDIISIGVDAVVAGSDAVEGIAAHELGHQIINFLKSDPRASSISRGQYLKTKKCLVNMHKELEPKHFSNFENEDFADLWAMNLSNNGLRQVQCRLIYSPISNFRRVNTTNYEKDGIATISPDSDHPNALFRLLHTQLGSGNDLPKECSQGLAALSQKFPQTCTLK